MEKRLGEAGVPNVLTRYSIFHLNQSNPQFFVQTMFNKPSQGNINSVTNNYALNWFLQPDPQGLRDPKKMRLQV